MFAETKSFLNKFNIDVSSLLMSSLRAIVICQKIFRKSCDIVLNPPFSSFCTLTSHEALYSVNIEKLNFRLRYYTNKSPDMTCMYAFDKQEAQRATYRAPEYNVPPFLGIGQGRHFCLLIGPKNTNLVEDVEILLPVKFR